MPARSRKSTMLSLVLMTAAVVGLAPVRATAADPAKPADKGDLSIAAASDLVYCLPDLNAAFMKLHPEANLKVTSGASGNFFAQITNGAPFDVFLSADLAYPRDLVKNGLADAGSITLYATGHIALWTTRSDLELSSGMTILSNPLVKRVAIANPDIAPYGRAARSALQSAGLWKQVGSKLVLGENIAQTAQFVQTGNVDVGIVSLSLLKSPAMRGIGRYFEIPQSLHPPLEQGGVMTNKGVGNPLAGTYIAFLRSPEARAVFDRYGFVLPESTAR